MKAFENTSDYTPVAAHYDKTRNMPEALLDECFNRIIDLAGLDRSGEILDAGCGTGQLSIPLIRAGFSVTGIDVSRAMLDIARSKTEPRDRANFIVSDVRSMKFPTGTFTAVMASKLFQHVGNWESAVDEIIRVTKDSGLFIHMSDKGAFGNAVRRKFTECVKARGFANLYRGIRDRCLLAVYLRRRGAQQITIDTEDLTWTKQVKYAEALEHLRLKLHSEFWRIPYRDYLQILEEVQDWIDMQPCGGDTAEELRPYLALELFRINK